MPEEKKRLNIDAEDFDIDWAMIVDFLASQYGWTIEYIKNLDMSQIIGLMKVANKRLHPDKEVSPLSIPEGFIKKHPELYTKRQSQKLKDIMKMTSSLNGKVVRNKDGSIKEVII